MKNNVQERPMDPPSGPSGQSGSPMVRSVDSMSDEDFLSHVRKRHPLLRFATRNEHDQYHDRHAAHERHRHSVTMK